MGAEQDAVFRARLVAVMTALKDGDGREAAVRRVVGSLAHQLARQAGAKNWSELKNRADGPTYDALLKVFSDQSEKFSKTGDSKGVLGVEALALSLIARHQQQGDLLPGVGFLDRFIEQCAALVRPPAKVVVTTKRR